MAAGRSGGGCGGCGADAVAAGCVQRGHGQGRAGEEERPAGGAPLLRHSLAGFLRLTS